MNKASLEQRIAAYGEQLLKQQNTATETSGWIDALMSRTIQDEHFRVQALRFVDVLPSLEEP